MTDKTPNMPVAGEVIITTRSQIIKVFAQWAKDWENTIEVDRVDYDDPAYAEDSADAFIQYLHTVK